MRTKILFILFLMVMPIAEVKGELCSANQPELNQKILNLTSPYPNKIGFAFFDLKSGCQLSQNGSQEFPAASVAKVPVMAAAYYLADLGKLNLDKKIKFHESDKLGGSGILQWIKGGKIYTLRNLIRLMIVLSDNTATKLVVDAIGTPEINSYLHSIGLYNTIIADPSMLVEPPANNNNLTSPHDMNTLIAKIYFSDGFSAAARQEMLGYMANQRYRWGIWRGVAPGTIVADKTGNLAGILNDIGIVFTKKGDYLLSVFTRDFTRQREARIIINEISRLIFEECTGTKVVFPKKIKRKYVKKRIYRKKTITKQRLRRRPSVKSRQRLGRRGAVSSRRSHSSPHQ